jgi:tRNA(His) 5'-end guanylyltransferase
MNQSDSTTFWQLKIYGLKRRSKNARRLKRN